MDLGKDTSLSAETCPLQFIQVLFLACKYPAPQFMENLWHQSFNNQRTIQGQCSCLLRDKIKSQQTCIRHAMNSRCYVNITATLPSSTVSIQALAWITGQHLVLHAGWDFVGLASCMCVECVDLDQTAHACGCLSPPPGHPNSQITVVAQCFLAVPLFLAHGKHSTVHIETKVFAQLWGENIKTTFGNTMTLVYQERTIQCGQK